jgi:O-6-methylguanine DNA methyltransferase
MTPFERLFYSRLASPLGDLIVVCNASQALCALEFEDQDARVQNFLARAYPRHERVDGASPGAIEEALRRYFGGEFTALDRLAVAVQGTAFQQQVWRALRRIAPGTTTSYGGLAASLRKAGASRAVGLANGSNPVGIVVPCHRVIGADGSLTGYGGGIARKRWLLAHEGALAWELELG